MSLEAWQIAIAFLSAVGLGSVVGSATTILIQEWRERKRLNRERLEKLFLDLQLFKKKMETFQLAILPVVMGGIPLEDGIKNSNEQIEKSNIDPHIEMNMKVAAYLYFDDLVPQLEEFLEANAKIGNIAITRQIGLISSDAAPDAQHLFDFHAAQEEFNGSYARLVEALVRKAKSL